jgi:selenocysteine-specific elongation factor
VRERDLVLRGLDPSGLVRAGGWAFSQAWVDGLGEDLRHRIAASDPLDPGIPAPPEPWSAAVVPLLGLERRGAKLVLPGAAPELGARAGEADRLETELAAAGYEPVPIQDARLAVFLEERGSAVRVGDGLAVSRDAYDEARRLLVAECEAAGSITLARFRDLLGTSRRPAQLLLERFDADGITRRTGDARVLRRAARA